MSNNKLYTEEEIVNFLKKEFADEINAETFMENLTPIKLPTQNDLDEILHDSIDEFACGYIRAIEHLEEQIKRNNK